jgi:divalent metal cation (Fe/Co/Zn/Cd) transporter
MEIGGLLVELLIFWGAFSIFFELYRKLLQLYKIALKAFGD